MVPNAKHHRRRRQRRGVSGVVLALAAVLTAGSAASVPAAATDTGAGQRNPVGESKQRPAAEGAEKPAVSWHQCAADWKVGKGWKCGTLETPLDHRDPQKGKLKLAVAKLPASDPSQRIGSLLTNSGGPGASGLEGANNINGWTTNVTKKVRERFDLVAYDPRGVGKSTPALNCAGPTPRGHGAQEDDASQDDDGAQDDDAAQDDDTLSNSPRTESEMLAQLKDKDDTGAQCVKNAGWLVPYMTTVDNVHDLDRLRAALGDSKLNFLGVSYGTTIAAVYANTYPERVRSLILHSVVDAKTQMNDPGAYSLGQSSGDEATVRAVMRACDRDSKHCAFHGNAEEKFNRLARHLGEAPRSGSPSVKDWNSFVGLADDADSPGSVKAAAEGLKDLYEKTFPSAQKEARTSDTVPTKEDEPENGNENDVLHTTDCLDLPPLPKENGPWLKRFARARAEAPILGPEDILMDVRCRDWPDDHRAALPRYTGPWNKFKRPVLVMNHQWDWATPLDWAKNMTKALGQRGTVVIEGFGHGDPTDCSRRWTEDYLLSGKVPTGVSKCDDGDTTPFS